jgi:hypothetical protein
MEVPTMQARLETRRFPAAAVAVVFAVVAVFIISAGSGYAIKSLSAPAVQKAPPAVRLAVQGGPTSDLTRVLPRATSPNSWGGPQSDLTRALPKPPRVQGGPESDLTRALPGQQTSGDTYFSTCTQLVRKPC